MSAPRKAAALRPPLFSFGQSDDLRVVASLADQYSSIFRDNDAAIDELCNLADDLHLDHHQLKDFQQEVSRAGKKEKSTDTVSDSDVNDNSHMEELEDSLRDQIKQLQSKIAGQKIRNEASTRLLDLSVLSMDKCVSGLREIYCQRAEEALTLHRKYTDIIDHKRQEYIDMLSKHSELEANFFKLVRDLGQVVNKTVDYRDVRNTADYHDALQCVTQGL